MPRFLRKDVGGFPGEVEPNVWNYSIDSSAFLHTWLSGSGVAGGLANDVGKALQCVLFVHAFVDRRVIGCH
jgi:hypothetical protein